MFVLYLAGHGVVVDGRYHYVPQDVIYENDQAIRAKALSEEKLKEWLALIEEGKRMMVIDSCHAGMALQTLAVLDTPLPRGVEDKAAIARLMKAAGSSVLAAASSKQQAMEGIVENGQGRGLFTHVLLKGLQGGADIIDKDGMIDVGELQSYTRKRVPELSQEKRNYEQFYADAENEPDQAYALTIMGEAEIAQRDYGAALTHLQQAIKLNPDIAQVYMGMGQLHHEQGQAIEALPWYQQAVERAPRNRRFLHNLAAVYAELGQLPQAETQYRVLLDVDNSQLLAWAELIEVLKRQGKRDEVRTLVQQTQQALAQKPRVEDFTLECTNLVCAEKR